MTPNPANTPKGYKTTEFWLAIFFMVILGAMQILQAIPTAQAAEYYGYVVMAYMLARGLAKFALPQYIVPETLPDGSKPLGKHPFALDMAVPKALPVDGFVEQFLLPLALPLLRKLNAETDGDYDKEDAKAALSDELEKNKTIPLSTVDDELLGMAIDKASLILKGVKLSSAS